MVDLKTMQANLVMNTTRFGRARRTAIVAVLAVGACDAGTATLVDPSAGPGVSVKPTSDSLTQVVVTASSVAAIDANGLVTGVAPGRVTITAKAGRTDAATLWAPATLACASA
jgi:hypothetical protein